MPDDIQIIYSKSMLHKIYKENSEILHYVDEFDNPLYNDLE